MGMDLLAVRSKTRSPRSFAVNRPTWRILRSLLLRLGCDIREMSDWNDGARIRAATCRQWARALRSAMPALHIVKVPRADVKRPEEHLCLCATDAGPFTIRLPTGESIKGVRRKARDPQSLPPENQRWLQRFSRFLETCGGCRQF